MNKNALYRKIESGDKEFGLIHPTGTSRVCKLCLDYFVNAASRKGKEIGKKVRKYFAKYGYPGELIHDTPYINCQACRDKIKVRTAKRKQNVERSRQLLQQTNKIVEDIENGTFRRHGGNKLEIRWRQLAANYIRNIGMPADTPFKERMRLYCEYREQRVDERFYCSSKWISLRSLIINAYGCTCMKCKRPDLVGSELHCDHILPRSLFPEHELDADNMQILCRSCNSSKSNRRLVDYRPEDWSEMLEKVIPDE